jgi:hypothetical protein
MPTRKSTMQSATLAQAIWIMGDMSTKESVWHDKEVEAFADVLTSMREQSQSKEVRDAAQYFADNGDDFSMSDEHYRMMNAKLDECKAVLETMKPQSSARFLFWLAQVGKRVSVAKTRGWFSGGSDEMGEEQMRGFGIVLMRVYPGSVMKLVLGKGELNPFLAIETWAKKNGS